MTEPMVVADSEAKAEFIKAHLGGRATGVVCPAGPLLALSPQTTNGPETGERPRFEALPAGQDLLAALLAHPGEVILALDSHAQAEFICWQIQGYLLQHGVAPGRLRFLRPAALTTEAMAVALSSMGRVDEQSGLATCRRQLFDERLGKHLTRLVGTSSGPGGLALSHRCLTILFLLAEHERERLRAQSLPVWRLRAELSTGGPSFAAWLVRGPGGLAANGLIRDETTARALHQKLAAGSLQVEEVRISPLVIPVPRPYQLAGIVPEAHDRLGISWGATLDILAKLFCGGEVGGRGGFILYSVAGADQVVQPVLAGLRERLAASHGERALDEASPRLEAGMILPVWPGLAGRELPAIFLPEESALYDLICLRAWQGQMRPATGEIITVSFRAENGCVFEAQFQKIISPGFQLIDPQARQKQMPPPAELPQKGQRLKASLAMFSPEPAAPASCTINILLRELADFAIPADLSTFRLLAGLIGADYIRLLQNGELTAGGNASTVVAILNKAFPRMQGISLAAYLEQTVAEAISGRKPLDVALAQFDQTMMLHGKVLLKPKVPARLKPRARTVSTIIKQPGGLPAGPSREMADDGPIVDTTARNAPALETGAGLPTVDGSVVEAPLLAARPERERDAPPGPASETNETGQAQAPAVATEASPAAEPTAPPPAAQEAPAETGDQGGLPDWAGDMQRLFAASLTEAPPSAPPVQNLRPPAEATPHGAAAGGQRLCPVCGQPLLRREDRFGPFWACSGFPACRHSETVSPDDLELPCPLCGQTLTRKQTPTGKGFYLCVNPGCQFMSWSLPHYLPCGICDSPYLVEKMVQGQVRLHCPRAGCPYEQALVADGVGRDSPSARPPPTSGATRKVRLVRRRR